MSGSSKQKTPFQRILELRIAARKENVGQVLERELENDEAELLIVTPRDILHHRIEAKRIVQCNVLKTHEAVGVLGVDDTWTPRKNIRATNS